jgi:hypothetical protein
LGVIGTNRPDLAREFSSVDFDEVVDVQVEAETLMPMPRTLRLYLLDQDLERGLLTPQEYRKQRPFAYAADQSSPYDVQEAKAKRVSEQIRMGMEPEPIVWQDNEAVHQDVLEQDIILAGDVPPEIREAAQQRWMALANQSATKQGPPPGMGAGPQGAPPGPPQGAPQGTPLPPQVAPTFGSNSSLPAAPGGGEQAAPPTAVPVQ